MHLITLSPMHCNPHTPPPRCTGCFSTFDHLQIPWLVGCCISLRTNFDQKYDWIPNTLFDTIWYNVYQQMAPQCNHPHLHYHKAHLDIRFSTIWDAFRNVWSSSQTNPKMRFSTILSRMHLFSSSLSQCPSWHPVYEDGEEWEPGGLVRYSWDLPFILCGAKFYRSHFQGFDFYVA